MVLVAAVDLSEGTDPPGSFLELEAAVNIHPFARSLEVDTVQFQLLLWVVELHSEVVQAVDLCHCV
jgi:hypothetical protein